jgi:hypothetical protein
MLAGNVVNIGVRPVKRVAGNPIVSYPTWVPWVSASFTANKSFSLGPTQINLELVATESASVDFKYMLTPLSAKAKGSATIQVGGNVSATLTAFGMANSAQADFKLYDQTITADQVANLSYAKGQMYHSLMHHAICFTAFNIPILCVAAGGRTDTEILNFDTRD